MFKKATALMITVLLAATAAGCGNTDGGATADQAAETTAQIATEPAAITDLSKPDNTKWRHMDEDDVYYQTGISYCETPAAESYEQLAVFVPGAFMNATDNGDGTFTCELNEDAQFMGYTASTAPILLPVITPGYHAEFALTDDSIDELMHGPASLTAFTSQGCIFVHSGCRPTSRRRYATSATATTCCRATPRASSHSARAAAELRRRSSALRATASCISPISSRSARSGAFPTRSRA